MQQITTVKRGILFLALSLCYSEAGAVSVVKSPHGARALECKDIKVPDAKKIQINNTGNLYNFKFVLPACGHASYQNLYPTAYIVQDLVDDFCKSGTVKLTVTQDPPSQPLAKTKFLLEVQQSLFNNRFAFREEVQLVYERNYIHMMNQSHILPGSVSKARWDHLNYYAISNGKMIASKSPQAGATPGMDIFQLLGNGMTAKMLMR